MTHPTSPAIVRACDELRIRWLAWQGRNGIKRKDALVQIGANASTKKYPRWASYGNIPWYYVERIKAQIGEAS